MRKYKTGRGLINAAINKLPFELHIPGYQYCGPGTKLQKRLERGDLGVNPLDKACKSHDIAYEEHKSGKERTIADRALASAAWKRVKSRDAGLGERAAALAVATAMKTKIGLSKLGAGLKGPHRRRQRRQHQKIKSIKKKKCCSNKKKKNNTLKKKKSKKCYTFKNLVKHTKVALKKNKPTNPDEILNYALGAAKHVVGQGRKGKISVPRIIPLPKTGGMLPLIPIFAGLSALGSLAGGTTAIVRAIGATKEAKEALKESQRHNNAMEAIAIGRSREGNGLYMKPYKAGYGLYLQPYPQSKN